jgi:hypothetical protein
MDIEEIQNDLEFGAEAEESMAAVLTYRQRQYPCSKTSKRTAIEHAELGHSKQIGFAIRVRLNAEALDESGLVFGQTEVPEEVSLPKAGQDVEVDDVPYTIDAVEEVLKAFLVLTLISPDRA